MTRVKYFLYSIGVVKSVLRPKRPPLHISELQWLFSYFFLLGCIINQNKIVTLLHSFKS